MNLTVQGIVVREWKAIFMPVRSYEKCYSKNLIYCKIQVVLSETADFTVASSGILTFLKLFLITKGSYLHLLALNFMETAVSHYNKPRSKTVFF